MAALTTLSLTPPTRAMCACGVHRGARRMAIRCMSSRSMVRSTRRSGRDKLIPPFFKALQTESDGLLRAAATTSSRPEVWLRMTGLNRKSGNQIQFRWPTRLTVCAASKVKPPGQHTSQPGEYVRPGLPCAGTGAKALALPLRGEA